MHLLQKASLSSGNHWATCQGFSPFISAKQPSPRVDQRSPLDKEAFLDTHSPPPPLSSSSLLLENVGESKPLRSTFKLIVEIFLLSEIQVLKQFSTPYLKEGNKKGETYLSFELNEKITIIFGSSERIIYNRASSFLDLSSRFDISRYDKEGRSVTGRRG